MNQPPEGIPTETWEEAVRAGFHATADATRSEVADILAAALPVLQHVPHQPGGHAVGTAFAAAPASNG